VRQRVSINRDIVAILRRARTQQLSAGVISEIESAIVDEKFTDRLALLVDVAVKYAHMAVLNAVPEQIISACLTLQLSPKVPPLLSVYVWFVNAECRDKDDFAVIVGIDVRICQRSHFIYALRQLVTDIVDSMLDATRYSLILFLRCSLAVITANDESDCE
jgi:hypothetical protein